MSKSEIRPRHRLTRLGFHFLFVGTFAMLGGALRGFNLLLVLAGLVVGTLIMQWRWSRRSVEAVSIQRRLPTEAFAGKSFRVRYCLRNLSRLMPIWMMRVEDRIRREGKSEVTHAACGVGVIAAGKTVLPHYDCVVDHRGLYAFGPMSLMTTFPFSLFSSRRYVDSAEQLHVFPALLNLHNQWKRQLLSQIGGDASSGRRSGMSEGEFFGLREWQNGDNPKWIHWRTSARLPDPAVRQFEQRRRFDLAIVVDGHDGGNDRQTELAISLAATLLVKLIGPPSNRIALAVAATEIAAAIGGGSSAGKRRLLELLAELSPTSNPSLSNALRKVVDIVGRTQDLVVISPRSMQAALDADSELSDAMSPWSHRRSFRWIDVSKLEINRWVTQDTIA